MVQDLYIELDVLFSTSAVQHTLKEILTRVHLFAIQSLIQHPSGPVIFVVVYQILTEISIEKLCNGTLVKD